ncbi:MAG TPA: abortive infection system antitoxin AbiGi family protein [Prosthecobacter sp.]|nr:abortive infection system antitoxin AbiGi family protein [Prosthecobacter sp.]
MNISASCLFRFTTKLEYIEEILTLGFGFRPCVEEMAIQSYKNDPYGGLNVIVDQLHSLAICFCDLPLSQSQDHRRQYGEYGIGMTKEWAMEQGISPVRYYHSNSPYQADSNARLMLDVQKHSKHHGNSFIEVLRKFMPGMPSDTELDSLPDSVKKLLKSMDGCVIDWLDQFYGAFHFTRIHEGEWKDRVTGEIQTRRFYDEREWRIVALDKLHRLEFQWSDVQHILVTNTSERTRVGELLLQSSDRLGIDDPTSVWSKVQVGPELLKNI